MPKHSRLKELYTINELKRRLRDRLEECQVAHGERGTVEYGVPLAFSPPLGEKEGAGGSEALLQSVGLNLDTAYGER